MTNLLLFHWFLSYSRECAQSCIYYLAKHPRWSYFCGWVWHYSSRQFSGSFKIIRFCWKDIHKEANRPQITKRRTINDKDIESLHNCWDRLFRKPNLKNTLKSIAIIKFKETIKSSVYDNDIAASFISFSNFFLNKHSKSLLLLWTNSFETSRKEGLKS